MTPRLMYRNVEVELDGDYKKGDADVAIKAKEGKPFQTCSMLRHHRGQSFSTAYLTVSVSNLEVEA